MFRYIRKKLFKSHGAIGVNLFPTTACDTGCRHCCDDSDCAKPVHFTVEMAQRIVAEARRLRLDLHVLLTGGGEPLMCPELIDIVRTFKSYERLEAFSIYTSGFLEKETLRKVRLLDLLQDKLTSRQISQSFSLYHNSFPERLRNMAGAMMEVNEKSFFCVRACVSLENMIQTNALIDSILKLFASEIGAKIHKPPIGWFPGDRHDIAIIDGVLSRESFALQLSGEVDAHSELATQWYVIKKDGRGVAICVSHISFIPEGRAKIIQETPFGHCICNELQAPIEGTYINIDADGSVYAECGCHPAGHMRLGNIMQYGLDELIVRRLEFSKRLMRAIITDKRMFRWGEIDQCIACRQICYEKEICNF